MAGKRGQSRKRTTLPARVRPGWLKRGDGRTQIFRALHERLAQLSEQYGGVENLSPVERSLVERFIHVEALAGQSEAKLRDGKHIDVGSYLSSVDRLHSLAKTMGLKRRSAPVVPLSERLADKGKP